MKRMKKLLKKMANEILKSGVLSSLRKKVVAAAEKVDIITPTPIEENQNVTMVPEPPQPKPIPKPSQPELIPPAICNLHKPITPKPIAPIPMPGPQWLVQSYQPVAKMSSISLVRPKGDDVQTEGWSVQYSFERDTNGHDTVTESYTTRKIIGCGFFQTICMETTYESWGNEFNNVPMPEPSSLTKHYELSSKFSSISITPLEWGLQDDISERWNYSLDFERDMQGNDTLREELWRTSRNFATGRETTLDYVSTYEDTYYLGNDSYISCCGNYNTASLPTPQVR